MKKPLSADAGELIRQYKAAIRRQERSEEKRGIKISERERLKREREVRQLEKNLKDVADYSQELRRRVELAKALKAGRLHVTIKPIPALKRLSLKRGR